MIRSFILIFGLLLANYAFGQDNPQKDQSQVVVTTKSGDVVKGILTGQDTKQLILQTSFGEVVIMKDDVVSIDKGSSSVKSSEYSGSHYLLNQSAFGLKKGQSYYENTYLFLNSYTAGLADNFSITVGLEVAAMLFGGARPGLYITPKLHFPFEGGAFAVSSNFVSYNIDDESLNVGILQGALSLGNLDNNLTIGAGFGYTFEDGFEDSVVPVSLSGITRVSDRVSLLSENWFAVGDFDTFGIISLGVRVHSRSKNNFLTVSLLRPTVGTGSFIAWPFFSGTVAIK